MKQITSNLSGYVVSKEHHHANIYSSLKKAFVRHKANGVSVATDGPSHQAAVQSHLSAPELTL